MLAWLLVSLGCSVRHPTVVDSTVDLAPPSLSVSGDQRYVWLVFDKGAYRIAFLSSGQGDLNFDNVSDVTIVDGVGLGDGYYSFTLPYTSAFHHLLFYEAGEGSLLGIIRTGERDCVVPLAAQTQSHPEQFAGFTGPFYQLAIENGAEVATIGACTP